MRGRERMRTFIFIYFILVFGVGINDTENRRAAIKYKTARERKVFYIYSLIAYFIVVAGITAMVAAVIYFLVHL